MLCSKNEVTSVKRIDAIDATTKLEISNPGTIEDTPHKRKTLIKNAKTPSVKILIGSAMICKIGLMNVFTTPNKIAATTAACGLATIKPGKTYATTRREIVLIVILANNFISIYSL